MLVLLLKFMSKFPFDLIIRYNIQSQVNIQVTYQQMPLHMHDHLLSTSPKSLTTPHPHFLCHPHR